MNKHSSSTILGILFQACVFGGCGSSTDSGALPSPMGDNHSLIRTTQYGQVRGIAWDEATHAWLGIPYARPPVRDLRWRAPRDPEAWDDLRLADNFSDPCPQLGGMLGITDLDLFGEPIGDEDCLFLNIWRPRKEEASQEEVLPVYFWIHGGGNSVGQAGLSLYHGANFASGTKCVFVSINYRLGPLGWFAHPALRTGDALDSSGNYGTLDMIKALEWVRNNISAFGGDPNNVTIAGESAGAIDVYSLLVSPLARGLFHRAVVESGSAWSLPLRTGDFIALGVIIKLLKNDSVASSEKQAIRHVQQTNENAIADYLRSKTPEELLACYGPALPAAMLPEFLNTIFEDGTVIPANIHTCLQAGGYNRVPLIVGNNAQEFKYFLPFLLGKQTEKELVGLLTDFDPNAPNLELEDILGPALFTGYEAITYLANAGWEVDATATLLSQHQEDVYAYQFAWDDEPEPMDFLFGASHLMEIPFVLGNFQKDRDSLFRFAWSEENRPERENLSRAMMEYWAGFMKTGDPNATEELLPMWSPWLSDPGTSKRILFDTGGPFLSAKALFNE